LLKNLIFDLDGTISDASEGIIKSYNYAIGKMGIEPVSYERGKRLIGPPIKDNFFELLHTRDEAVLNRAIEYYRERYFSVGFKENTIYPKMAQLLTDLSNNGCRLFIVSNKYQVMVENILEMFEIQRCFTQVWGTNGTKSKTETIKEIISSFHLDKSETAMIGDRDEDIVSARENGIWSILVLWGFAPEDELSKICCDYRVKSVKGLKNTIEKWQY
jgi:phosphoglycolate phosphatase